MSCRSGAVIQVGHRRGLRKTGIHADEFPAPFLALRIHFIEMGDSRQGWNHHEDDVRILQIDPVIRHCSSTERLSQSRYSGGVSETRLVLYMHTNPQERTSFCMR